MKDYRLVTTKLTAVLRERAMRLRSQEMIRFPPERELAAELHVSRESLRTAIKKLMDEGLLVQRQGSGTYVVPQLGVTSIHLLKAADIKHSDPFYMSFLSEITDYISQDKVPLYIVHERNLPTAANDASLIILGYIGEASYSQARMVYKRIVAVQSHPMYRDVAQVDVNYYKIGFDAAAELAKHGHKSILHIAGPDGYPAATARRMGFEDGSTQYGLEAHVIKGKMNWNFGYSIAEDVLGHYVKAKKVSAIFAANDWLALGLITRLQEMGAKIPDTVSIIGCDDIALSSEIVPPLSTFKEDFPLLIGTVYQQLNAMVATGNSPGTQVLLPAKFIKRASLQSMDQ
jgi:DNA-binding LacI/PurR family transcriptional regulator